MEEEIGKSNWLEDKEKVGGSVTVKEINQLHQEAIEELMELEKVIQDNYLATKIAARLHIYFWELRDAGWKAVDLSIKECEEEEEEEEEI